MKQEKEHQTEKREEKGPGKGPEEIPGDKKPLKIQPKTHERQYSGRVLLFQSTGHALVPGTLTLCWVLGGFMPGPLRPEMPPLQAPGFIFPIEIQGCFGYVVRPICMH
jgi:hypothetical protein